MSLQAINTHSRDYNITFEEKEHIYTIKGDSTFTSVTTWIHSHFGHFDADSVIKKIRKKKNYKESIYFEKTDDDIKNMWEINRNQAADAGTKLHFDIECYYNDNPNINESVEYGYFLNFAEKYSNLKPYRTEWMIYDEDLKLAGSIDMIFKKDNEYAIYDWKRSKEIKKSNWGRFSHTECINHLPDANFWHYSLQLNIYKSMLEKNYDITITDMYIVCLHPNHDTYINYKIPDLKHEVEELFMLRKTQI